MELLCIYGVQLLALILCTCNFICAGEFGGLRAFIRNFCIFAGVVAWWCIGGAVFTLLPCRIYWLELCGYALVGFSGLIPFTLLFLRALRRQDRHEKQEFFFGILAVLIYNSTLFFLIGDTCLHETGWTSEKLFQENLLDAIFHFSLPGTVLCLLAFVILFLIFGALHGKFSGFFKNALVIFGGPFFSFAVMIFGMILFLEAAQKDMTFTCLLLPLALGILLAPGAVRIIRGLRSKDKLLFYNGLTGLGSAVFFLLTAIMLGFFSRHV